MYLISSLVSSSIEDMRSLLLMEWRRRSNDILTVSWSIFRGKMWWLSPKRKTSSSGMDNCLLLRFTIELGLRTLCCLHKLYNFRWCKICIFLTKFWKCFWRRYFKQCFSRKEVLLNIKDFSWLYLLTAIRKVLFVSLIFLWSPIAYSGSAFWYTLMLGGLNFKNFGQILRSAQDSKYFISNLKTKKFFKSKRQKLS